MADQTSGKADQPSPIVPEDIGFRAQLAMMLRAFKASPLRNTILWLAAGALTVIVATSLGQIILNRWNRPFYDAIERRDLDAFFHQLLVFVAIAGGLLTLGVIQTWLNQMMKLKLREGLTRDLITEWMRPRRAFRLANAGAIGINPDQRMQEDAGHLTDLTTGLGFGLVQSSILLASFVGVLWSLSSGFVFHVGGHSFAIPGYMVWAAILYAGSASMISWLVGRPLIALNSDRYSREADLRFSMMRVNEHVDAISLAGGEADEKRRLETDLTSVLGAVRRIFTVQIYLEWVTDGYGWITLVAPILVASPVYFAGDISFGGLMMAVGAFNQVHSSLRWFINNIGAIADWRATLLRIAAFRRALVEADVLHDTEKRIEFVQNDDNRLTFDGLEVASTAGCTKFAEPRVEIAAGERVLVTGDPGAGKTLFFRALARLWPWGGGHVGTPAGETITFVPRTPYFPPGTLRAVLSYPQGEAGFVDAELKDALSKVGLERLEGSLDRDARWERELSEEEQRMLAFGRLSLHKPRWVIIDEALDTLDRVALKKVLSIFEDDLPDATVVNIGRAQRKGDFFSRELHLVKDKDGHCLKRVDFTPAAPKRRAPRKGVRRILARRTG
ncbi:ABC transporter ATP-binding protein/permease [Mesorhizobium sp. ZC-5]|uniref:ABC transporter ATP-binding protein/permease n=1 Tax=Mesorhizobium sp. ZC-5 TaxID=2986066 RepID=UPI0021E800FB|nr:ABC transporter ATP-binding protein/permease [Mesorhizobium sp. ZC-5]MCV3238613.1 ABC transporter ATP-binding protein/permease [Mesorhizobium sp. ZC-5]